jgi:hypothetical protein
MASFKEKVQAKWPDAEISTAFAVQPDKSRRWMYCVMSSMKFLASRGKKERVLNVGSWRFTEQEAWADAAQAGERRERVRGGGE